MKYIKIIALIALLGTAGTVSAIRYGDVFTRILKPTTVIEALHGTQIEIYESYHNNDKCYTAVSPETSVFSISCVSQVVK